MIEIVLELHHIEIDSFNIQWNMMKIYKNLNENINKTKSFITLSQKPWTITFYDYTIEVLSKFIE